MDLPTSTPSREGVDPGGLLAFLDAVDADPRIEPHGLILQRHGRRVLESYWSPHRAEQIRLVYSLSKSFTGAALGLAVGDGLVSLEDLVVDHLPAQAAGADERTARMRIRHLASMATGHQDETLLDALVSDPADMVGAFLRLPTQHEPGTWFAYNQPPVLALSTILHRVTGRRLVDQLRTRLLDPIGVGELRWTQYRPGIDVGFSGVFTNLDAIARLGQLHLDDGVWGGRRILPEGWVAEASRIQVDSSHRPEPDWSRGYGIQCWMCRHGFRGDGAYGQFMVVLPEHDAVVAFFSHTDPMQAFLDHAWELLIPALGPAADPDPAGDEAVAARAAGLRLPTVAERTGSRPADAVQHVAPVRMAPRNGVANHRTITAVDVVDGAWWSTRARTWSGCRCRRGGATSPVIPSRRAPR